MGASEGFQSLCGYSLDPVFPLFSLQLRVLGDRYESEYRLDHLSSCRLSLCFYSMDLSCFLPRAFRSHFFFTLLSLTRYFGICSLIIFLHCTPITGSVPHSLFDPWFDFRLDAHIFVTRKVKGIFSYSHIFWEIRLDHLIIFSLMELELKVESRMFCYRLSIDLMIGLFFAPHSFSSHLDHFFGSSIEIF